MKKFFRIVCFSVLVLAGAAAGGYFYLTSLSPEQQALSDAMNRITGILESKGAAKEGPAPAAAGKAFTATLQLLKGEGVPKELMDVKLDLCVALPDRLRVTAQVKGETVVAGRKGDEVWAWQAAKKFAVRAAPGVPVFEAEPERLDTTHLGPLAIPVDTSKLSLLPALCQVEMLAEESVDGQPCKVLKATPLEAAKKLLGLDSLTLQLWLRADGFPVRIGFRDGGRTDILLALRDVKTDAMLPPETWELPAPADAKVEKVPLHHAKKFFEGALALLKQKKLPTLGPASGEQKVLATSGRGRLEMHDGTQVLFLAGTPEEMGAQHGALMGEEARHLVSRLLYGVGVGSSFAKGSWFFGTIEDCQTRIQPFVDTRYTREMDALAAASGLASQEVRLANFFPELFHCSGFALSGAATKDGRIYHGRVLDYMKGVGLEQNAVVMVMQPDVGHAWVNLGYAGFIGSVTAMNEAGISIGEMGGRGEGNWDGKPMAQLMREVMEKAGTLDEAVAVMRDSPRTCEYYYVIADGKTRQAVGIKATHEIFEVVKMGEKHPQLDTPVQDTVLLSAGDRYKELVKRVQGGWGKFDDSRARELMTTPVCMNSNIQSVLFAPDTLDFWVANADNKNVASHTRYTHYNLAKLLGKPEKKTAAR